MQISSTPLDSPNAVAGRVHLLFIDARDGTQDVRRFDDTAGDYGEAFTSLQRSILARGEPLENSCGAWLCMTTATRAEARRVGIRGRLRAA